MRKKYEKPKVYFEEMRLDTAIADACTLYVFSNCSVNNFGENAGCQKYGNESIVFVADNLCPTEALECYHVSAATAGTLVNQS